MNLWPWQPHRCQFKPFNLPKQWLSWALPRIMLWSYPRSFLSFQNTIRYFRILSLLESGLGVIILAVSSVPGTVWSTTVVHKYYIPLAHNFPDDSMRQLSLAHLFYLCSNGSYWSLLRVTSTRGTIQNSQAGCSSLESVPSPAALGVKVSRTLRSFNGCFECVSFVI